METPSLKVVTLRETNLRDTAATLRNIADDIEKGTYGKVGSLALCLLGDTFELFSMGSESDPGSVTLLLEAGILRISGVIERHGRE